MQSAPFRFIVHLHAPLDVLLGRIKKRGRSYEKEMDAEYLDRLRSLYQQFFSHYDETPLLEVDTSDIDFSKDDTAVEHLMDEIAKAYSESTGK